VPENVAAAATAWCDVHGFACAFVGTGDILRVTGSAVEIGSVLNVELESFEHPTSGARIVRTRGVVYPSAEMSEWADCLMGLNTFPTLTRAANPTTNAAPAITPALLKGETLYNITDVASADSKSSMAVAEFQGQGFLPADLAKFESKFGLPSQPVRKVAGDPSGDKSAGTEAELDIQYVLWGHPLTCVCTRVRVCVRACVCFTLAYLGTIVSPV
jgi:subtilase family serine protease